MTDGRWRVGRVDGRTVYVQLGAEPSDGDPLIGTMDTPDLASSVVAAHNRLLDDAAEARDPVTEKMREDAANVVERACRMMESYAVPRAAKEAAQELRATVLQLIDLATRRPS